MSRRMLDRITSPPVDRTGHGRSYARPVSPNLAWRRRTRRANLSPGAQRWARLGPLGNRLDLDVQARNVAPQLLEPVELAHLVDDDVEVVHQDPARLADALDAARHDAMVLLEALVHGVVDRLRLAIGVAG